MEDRAVLKLVIAESSEQAKAKGVRSEVNASKKAAWSNDDR